MRVKIGNFGTTYSFYGWVNHIFPENVADWLNSKLEGTKFAEIVANSLNYIFGRRTIKIKTEPYDAFSADHTIALVVLPILKEFRKALTENKCGYPTNIKLTRAESRLLGLPYPEPVFCALSDDNSELYSNFFDAKKSKWISIVDQIIWSFQQIVDCNEIPDECWIVKPEIDLTKYEEDEGEGIKPLRWKVEGQFNEELAEEHNKRIDKGLELFSKHFRSLWW